MSDNKLVKALTDSAQRKLSRTKKNGGPGLTQNIFFILCFGLSQNCHFLSLIVSLRKIINYVYSRIFHMLHQQNIKQASTSMMFEGFLSEMRRRSKIRGKKKVPLQSVAKEQSANPLRYCFESELRA